MRATIISPSFSETSPTAIPVARVHSTPLPTFQGLSAARSKARERQIALEGVIHRVFGFILIAGFVFMVSSMMGNVMLEKASRDARQDLRRLNVAGKVVGVIRDQVDGLSQSAALDKWALNHNFYNPQAQAVYNGQSTQ